MSRVISFSKSSHQVFDIFFFVFGILVFLFASFVYSEFLYSQYIHTNINRNVRILNCRLALIVPVYGILFLGILVVPHLWDFFEVGISFVEGYCIYCFYKMLSYRVGNKNDIVTLIQESEYTRPCCASCQKKTPRCCYSTIEIVLIQFFTLRPFLFLMIAFVELADDPNEDLLQLLTILTVISLVVAMIGLLRSYNFMVERTRALLPAQKVLFIKAIILLMVIQNLIISSQQETGIFAKHGHDQEEEHVEHFDTARRWYAAMGIIETFLFSFLVEKIFKIHDNDEMRESLSQMAKEAPSGTYQKFVVDIMKLWTVITILPESGALMDEEIGGDTGGVGVVKNPTLVYAATANGSRGSTSAR